jgi:multidrug transporter EmrE-like cation transporter
MKGMGFILLSIGLNVVGQLLMRHTMIEHGEVEFSFGRVLPIALELFSKPLVIFSLFLYLVAGLFWLVALSKVELSVAYPMLSLGYVAVFVLSWLLLSENVSVLRFLGTAIIGFGIYLLTRS